MGRDAPYVGLVLAPAGEKLRSRATEGLNETTQHRPGIWEGVAAPTTSTMLRPLHCQHDTGRRVLSVQNIRYVFV